MSKNEHGDYLNSKLLIKPEFHIVGNDHKRKGKFILCAKNKLRHEFLNIINKNVKSSRTDYNEHDNILSIFQTPKKLSLNEDNFVSEESRISYEENKESTSSRRRKHPKIILPEK